MKPTSSFAEVTVRDWQEAGLLKPSVIKPVITTIEKSFVLQKLGRLKQEDQAALRQALAVIVG